MSFMRYRNGISHEEGCSRFSQIIGGALMKKEILCFLRRRTFLSAHVNEDIARRLADHLGFPIKKIPLVFVSRRPED